MRRLYWASILSTRVFPMSAYLAASNFRIGNYSYATSQDLDPSSFQPSDRQLAYIGGPSYCLDRHLPLLIWYISSSKKYPLLTLHLAHLHRSHSLTPYASQSHIVSREVGQDCNRWNGCPTNCSSAIRQPSLSSAVETLREHIPCTLLAYPLIVWRIK